LDLPLKELRESSELLYFMVWRDLKVRYKQAVIGAGWAVLKPLMLMLVFVFVFSIFIRVPTGDIPYSVVVYTGILPWTFITTVIGAATASLISNSTLLTKLYFPRILAPLSVSLVALIDLVISLPILFGIMLWYNIPITPRVLWLPLLFGMIFLLSFGIGLILAALHVKYHDIGLLLPIILQMWMYATPVVYPIELVPARWLPFYSLNPFVGLIQAIRWALVDVTRPTPFMLASSIVLTIVVLVGSVAFFQRAEDTFADVV
jgi:lipopolysaccharide transport system permease protein